MKELIRMNDNEKFNNCVRDIALILVVGMATHWFMIVISGYWWDDSIFQYKNYYDLSRMYIESGNMFGSALAFIMINIRNAYNIWTFALTILNSILIYFFLRNSLFVKRDDSIWIALIFTTVPINDARIVYACFPYMLCYVFFSVALYLVTVWKRMGGMLAWGIRVISWMFLFVSYTIASFLVFTGIIILWIYYYEFSVNYNKTDGNIWWWLIRCIVKNIDYVIVPIVYWIIKITYYPTQGFCAAVGYNSVSFAKMWLALKSFPLTITDILISIYRNYFLGINEYVIFVLYGALILTWWVKTKKCITKTSICNNNDVYSIVIILVGVITTMAGIFPYSVVKGQRISINGIEGRDSLLLGLGFAMLAYGTLNLITKEWVKRICLVFVVVLGMFHFNKWYVTYQETWYESLEFKNAINTETDIIEGSTFLVVTNRDTPCESSRFYCYNICAYEILGDQTRFFGTIKDLMSIDELLNYSGTDRLYGYGMDEYDYNDMAIDGILFMENPVWRNGDIYRLKALEIFKPDEFDEEIKKITKYSYIDITPDESRRIIELYKLDICDEKEIFNTIKVEKNVF